jgi:hypothetical protein
MLSILSAPWLNESSLSFRTKLKLTSNRRVRCAFQIPVTQNQVNAGTIDYTTASIFQLGSTDINGFLVPERYEGYFNEQVLAGSNSLKVGGEVQIRAAVTATGAQQAIVRRRFLFPYKLPSGKTVGNMRIYTYSTSITAEVANGIFESANTGTTGTESLTLNFGRITSSGTQTQISTTTQSRALTATTVNLPISIASVTTGTSADEDMLYVELIADVNQTARTAGGGNISVNYITGVANSSSDPTVVILFEFDII